VSRVNCRPPSLVAPGDTALHFKTCSTALPCPGIHRAEAFPPTRHSVVQAAQSEDPAARSRAIEAITAAYWKPVYKYVRMKWNISSDDAADFTQEFLPVFSWRAVKETSENG
jgi:hypothetical protein